jgi:hypothetical protein
VPKPSSEIEKCWTRASDIAGPPSLRGSVSEAMIYATTYVAPTDPPATGALDRDPGVVWQAPIHRDFAEPSGGLEPPTPPYHGGLGAVPAGTDGHSRSRFSCKSALCGVSAVSRRARACPGRCTRLVPAARCRFLQPTGNCWNEPCEREHAIGPRRRPLVAGEHGNSANLPHSG